MLPSKEQFANDIRYLYPFANQTKLHPQLLESVINNLCYAYSVFTPGHSLGYKEYLRANLKALTDFTTKCPSWLKGDLQQSIFYTIIPLISGDDDHKMMSALHALNHPLFGIRHSFSPDNTKAPVLPEDPYPIWPDDFTEAQKRRASEKYHKDYNDAYEALTPIQKALAWTPLYWAHYDFEEYKVSIPFDIPSERWFEGTWIVANQGRGKTNLLRHLVLNAPQDACLILMDAKGDLINSFNHMAHLKDHLVFIDPDPDCPLAINPLNIGAHSIEFLEYVFAALLETPLTPLQATLFRLTLTLAVVIPHATLETFRDIIQNGWKKYESYVRKLRPRDQDFFDKEFDTATYAKTKQEIMWRLRTLMTVPALDAIFQSPVTKLDIGTLMDQPYVICINNNYELLGDQGSEFFARLFIALVWAAARKRSRLPDHLKRPVYFFIDEAHYAIARDTKITTIIHQCRSQKIAMIFSHQEVQQIKDEDVRSALSNCAIKFANSTGEAHELAPRLDTTPEFIKAQQRWSICLLCARQDPFGSISPGPLG